MQVQTLTRQRWVTRIYLVLFALVLVTSSLVNGWPALSAGITSEIPNVASFLKPLPLAFVPNRGQAEANVRYVARGQSAMAFAPQEIALQVQGQALHLSFVGANPAPEIVADAALPGVINEIQGNDPATWYTNLPAYAGLTYQGIYPGVDLRYDGVDGRLKSTFALAPGVAPALIRWQYRGAQAVALDQATGDLRITLSDETQVMEKAPIAWQEVGGQRRVVSVAYQVAEDGSVGFALGAYDPALPLVIDPTIVWETTVDLAGQDTGRDIVVDAAGNAYVLARAYDTDNDVLVAKFSPAGDLLYTTFLRGNRGDFGGGITLGQDGVYLAGFTDSDDFPVTPDALQGTINHFRDAFIAKLSLQDGSLLYSTFFGGSRGDEARDIALNSAGEIYIVGRTSFTDYPTTANAIQGNLNLNQCFCDDATVTKFSADGQTVLYSTYLGGERDDQGIAIGLDAADNIYIAGHTNSYEFPTVNPLDASFGEGLYHDIFVARISDDGGTLEYSTYLGGDDWDRLARIFVDDAGNTYVGGTTRSEDFPTTAGAFQPNFVGEVASCGGGGFGNPIQDCDDVFISKLAPDGSAFVYSTFLGGTDIDVGNGLAVDGSGQVHVVGYTNSQDFPEAGPFSSTEIFASKLSADGSDVLYTVMIDSPIPNSGGGVAVDGNGDAYITGGNGTIDGNFVSHDLYVAKISDGGEPPPPPTPTSVPPTPTNTPVPPPPTNTPVPPPPTNTPVLPPPTNTPVPPPPTPTPPAGSTLHIGDLDGASAWTFRRWRWRAAVTIAVHDADHNPVADATVSGNWTGGYSGGGQCTTGGDGTCQVSTGGIWRYWPSVTFAVADASATGYTFTFADNHDPDGDSNGTQITVSRP
jgi:hypothetical protein